MTLPFRQHASVLNVDKAGPDDLDAILAILTHGWKRIYHDRVSAKRIERHVQEQVRPIYQHILSGQSNSQTILAAKLAGVVHGFICFEEEERRHHIKALYVDKAHEKKSVGALMLFKAADEMRARDNSKQVAIHICTANHQATHYAESLNGRRDGQIRRQFLPDTFMIDQIIKWPDPKALYDYIDEILRRRAKNLPVKLNAGSPEWEPSAIFSSSPETPAASSAPRP